MTNLNHHFFYGVKWNLIDKVTSQLGYFICTLFIARIIGPESFGIVGLLTIFMLLLESTVNYGFTQALIQKSTKLTERDCSTIFYATVIWSICIYSILYISAPFIAHFYQQPKLIPLSRVLFLGIFINLSMVVTRAKLSIAMDFKSQALSSLFGTIISSIISIYLALSGFNYWALIALILSKNAVTSLSLLYFCRWYPQFIFCLQSFKSLFKFGSNLMLSGILSTLTGNFYMILIGRYFNPTFVGYYNQANNLSNYASQVITAPLQTVTFPLMSAIQNEKEKLATTYQNLISITMFFSLPLLIGFSSISKEVITVFLGPVWIPAIPILTLLCLARCITPISAINMNILNAIGRSDLFLKLDLCKIPISIGLLFTAIPFGILGIAWASVISTAIAFFINTYYAGKLFNFGAIKQLKIAFNYILASATMFLCLYFLSIENTILSLCTKITLGILIYSIILFSLKDSQILRWYNFIYIRLRKN